MNALLLLASLAQAAPAPKIYKSGPERVALVELYSSEGCSSCPPADAWVSSLSADPGLWTRFVPAVFHVDYWDGLGWKDVLAAPEYTARQRGLARRWGTETVYTPGMVLDGAEWRGWGRGSPRAKGAAGTLEIRVAGGRLRAVYKGMPGEAPKTVVVARLALGLSNDVTRGENEGRTLKHEFVVRGLSRTALTRKGEAWTADAAVPAGTAPLGAAGALAAWIEDADGRPLQAAGGPLSF